MKCNESWLREWINPMLNRDKLCSALTMAGLEVEELAPIKESELAQAVSKKSLNDYIIDISITPNRGDCLSIRGLAREISAITNTPLGYSEKNLSYEISRDTRIISRHSRVSGNLQKSKIPINLKAKPACPRYVSRIIRNVKPDAMTPDWIKDRLLCAGVKVISPVVDVTNYVMLELGQPMHAFDLNTIEKEINVRLSKKGEKIILLDGSTKELNSETLIIADQTKPLAIAGVMGGLNSSVTLKTTDILLESAFFSSVQIAKQRQYYGVSSESAYRFERGVDPTIQRQAIERATQLILEIAGGSAGSIMEEVSKPHLPKKKTITLTSEKIQKVLGTPVPIKNIETIFKALNFEFKRSSSKKHSGKNSHSIDIRADIVKWVVQVPSYRFDLTLPEDLIEEIARLYGYDKIPSYPLQGEISVNKTIKEAPDLGPLRQMFYDLGYQEIISYSFVDEKLQNLLNPDEKLRKLLNPITADMGVMRTNLWPGLIQAMLFNKNRQQNRIRLFEVGVCFFSKNNQLEQSSKVSGLITGLCFPEQWGHASREVDFFDLKGDVENILHKNFPENDYEFKPVTHPALHSGKTAGIFRNNKQIGMIGALHPELLQTIEATSQIYLFELDLNGLQNADKPVYRDISKFPEIRRDIAILIKQTIPSESIQDTIKVVAGSWLKDVFIFDVYQGKGISPGLKSIALALILQHPTRTLVDDEVAELMDKVISALKGQLGAELRS